MRLHSTALYPLLLQPALHKKVWGGRRLETLLDKPLPTDDPYGEAWELHDTATVANGALAGRTIADLVRAYGADLIGAGNNPDEGCPLLVKFLDAKAWLSVQVHPDDAQAQHFNDGLCGKSEAWYVVAAEPDSRLVIGLAPGTTRDIVARAIDESDLERLLVYAPVTPGDVLMVSPGTVHALGPGILIYEIQQSSDLTYRLYDWGRMDLNGMPRELHKDKSLHVSNLGHVPEIVHTGDRADAVIDIVSCDYFRTNLYQNADGRAIHLSADERRGGFDALTCIDGQAVVEAGGESVVMDKGRSVMVPACLGGYTLTGQARVLRSVQNSS